jgi:hypothetical protein
MIQSDPIAGMRRAIDRLDEFTPKLAALAAERADLYGALDALLRHYVKLVNSGDAGDWDPEDEAVVIRARQVLAQSGRVSKG